jgi:hypothetical protein
MEVQNNLAILNLLKTILILQNQIATIQTQIVSVATIISYSE